ncbi:MAG: hypothetical protein K6E95_00355 [Lachnospiraceae bacterium]|nr:hypothetical protein [Lachnospiraceae bacterium]
MEKYKFIVKLGQIKDLINKGLDDKAIEIAETLDIKKIKNIEDLGNVAALFLKKGMLLKARDCYRELYERVSNRNTVMQLINLALRLKRPHEAEMYLREYQKIDRNDFYGLIFKYNIDKLEGKPYKELIPTLEKLKKKEYIEAWAYELAKLYHKSGDVEKCIAECDDLIVFFGEGEYVERAKVLKDYYEKNGGRESLEKEKAQKEAEERAKKEEQAEENARAVEEAFAKHAAIDPDVTELKQEDSEVKSSEPEKKPAPGIESKMAEPEKPAPGIESKKEEPEKKPQLDKDDMLLMQLLREEGIEQPDGPIIEMDMELEEEEEAASAETAEQEEQEEEPVAEQEPEEEEEAVSAETAEQEEQEEEPVAEQEPEEEEEAASAETTEQEEEPVAAQEEKKEELPISYNFTTDGLTEVPEGSRLKSFLEKNDSKLDDLFGYMAYINDIRVQLIKALELLLNPQIMVAGIVITAAERDDIFTVIKGIVKIENKSGYIKDVSCPIAPAVKINKMDLENKVSKFVGRRLVIENAGMLDKNAVQSVMRISENYGRKLGVVLADSRGAIMSLLRDNRDLNSILPVRIHIPVIDEEDICNMVRYSIAKGGYSVKPAVEKEILARVKAIKAEPASKYALAHRFIGAVTGAADRRMTQDYLDATADGRKIIGENAIKLEDVGSV